MFNPLSDHHHPAHNEGAYSSSSSSSSSPITTSSYSNLSRSPTTTIRRRRGAVVHKAINSGSRKLDDVDVRRVMSLFVDPSSTSPPPLPTTTTTTTTTTEAEPAMSDFPLLPAEPIGTRPHQHPSYADAAAHNAPPSSAQPHPDKNLLYTGPSPTHPTTAPDVDSKVSVVPHDWATHPTTETSLHIDIAQSASDTGSDDNHDSNRTGSTKRKARKQRERRDKMYSSRREVNTFWRHFTDRVVRTSPGLIPILNLGVLSGIGYTLYAHPHARTNPRFLALSGLGALALLSVEGLTAQRYLDSPNSHQTQQEIKRKTKEIVLRPGIFGGLLGAVNLAVLATLGWFAYDRWSDTSVWTRRNLSVASVGLLGWFGGQGLIIEQYATKEYPLRKERK